MRLWIHGMGVGLRVFVYPHWLATWHTHIKVQKSLLFGEKKGKKYRLQQNWTMGQGWNHSSWKPSIWYTFITMSPGRGGWVPPKKPGFALSWNYWLTWKNETNGFWPDVGLREIFCGLVINLSLVQWTVEMPNSCWLVNEYTDPHGFCGGKTISFPLESSGQLFGVPCVFFPYYLISDLSLSTVHSV